MKYNGPKWRVLRAEGLKPDKSKKDYPPGVHGQTVSRKRSEYGRQLREKQKTKRLYNVTEKTFRNLYKKAIKMEGNTGENLMRLLKMRLDNVVRESGWANSIYMARQLVNHGFFTVKKKNGEIVKRANVPSMTLEPEDTIQLKKTTKKHVLATQQGEGEKEKKKDMSPRWLEVDNKGLNIKVIDTPKDQELDPALVSPQLIIEFYSR